MKVIEVKKESLNMFMNDIVGIQGCNIAQLESFFVPIEKLEADQIQFILDEVTNMTRTEIESVVTFKKETYDSINNKYVKQ